MRIALVAALMSAALAVLPILGSHARADNFPSHPITIVVPFSAGGPTDAMARILAERMRVTLGQTLLIENVTGAGGSLGVGRVVRAPADGYTISIGHLGTHVANGAVYKLGYDLVADLEPVVMLPSNPMVIVSNDKIPAKTLPELLAWLKAKPTPPTAGTAGAGSGSHIAGLYFENTTGIKLQYVPYRGTAPALTDLVAGQIDLIIDQTSNSISQIRAGTIRAYAVTDNKRVGSAPEIPSTDEAGLKGFHMTLWSGLWVPKDTTRDISHQTQRRRRRRDERSGRARQVRKAGTGDAAQGSNVAASAGRMAEVGDCQMVADDQGGRRQGRVGHREQRRCAI